MLGWLSTSISIPGQSMLLRWPSIMSVPRLMHLVVPRGAATSWQAHRTATPPLHSGIAESCQPHRAHPRTLASPGQSATARHAARSRLRKIRRGDRWHAGQRVARARPPRARRRAVPARSEPALVVLVTGRIEVVGDGLVVCSLRRHPEDIGRPPGGRHGRKRCQSHHRRRAPASDRDSSAAWRP